MESGQTHTLEPNTKIADYESNTKQHSTLPVHFGTHLEEHFVVEARHLLVNVQTQGRAADEKVRALFTANTIFVAALVVGSSSSLVQLSVPSLTPLNVLDLFLRGALLLALAISLGSSVLGLVP